MERHLSGVDAPGSVQTSGALVARLQPRHPGLLPAASGQSKPGAGWVVSPQVAGQLSIIVPLAAFSRHAMLRVGCCQKQDFRDAVVESVKVFYLPIAPARLRLVG